jgi:hypothetical protein
MVSYALLGVLSWGHKWYDLCGWLGLREEADQFWLLALAGLQSEPRSP